MREGEREGEKYQCMRDTSIGCLSHAPNWGPGLQPRHVPWLGIKPATFWFAGWCSIHWATPTRAWRLLRNYILFKEKPTNQRVVGSLPSVGHMPGSQAGSPVGGVWEATAHWCFSPFLPPSLPFSKNKWIKSLGGKKEYNFLRSGVCVVYIMSSPGTIGSQ